MRVNKTKLAGSESPDRIIKRRIYYTVTQVNNLARICYFRFVLFPFKSDNTPRKKTTNRIFMGAY